MLKRLIPPIILILGDFWTIFVFVRINLFSERYALGNITYPHSILNESIIEFKGVMLGCGLVNVYLLS